MRLVSDTRFQDLTEWCLESWKMAREAGYEFDASIYADLMDIIEEVWALRKGCQNPGLDVSLIVDSSV